jgi:hypothetical protein
MLLASGRRNLLKQGLADLAEGVFSSTFAAIISDELTRDRGNLTTSVMQF